MDWVSNYWKGLREQTKVEDAEDREVWICLGETENDLNGLKHKW